jgi:hypothetical protein
VLLVAGGAGFLGRDVPGVRRARAIRRQVGTRITELLLGAVLGGLGREAIAVRAHR